MEKNHTRDLLIQFLYHEIPAERVAPVARFIRTDAARIALFDRMTFAKHQLPAVQFSPAKTSLDRILQYSERTAVLA